MEFVRPKIFFTKHPEGDVYKFIAEGFDINTGERKCILKNTVDGKRWCMSSTALEEVRLVDGQIIKIWERMPEGWHPIKQYERPYPGYTDDPREEIHDGRNDFGQRYNSTVPQINNGYRRRTGFR